MKNYFSASVKGLFILLLLSGALSVQGQQSIPFSDESSEKWADSLLNVLSLDEKIGQLFMVEAYSNKDSSHVRQVTELIEEQKVGGLIFFQGGPDRQAFQTNLYQSKATIPLLVSIDGEWGLSMRLDSTIRYPRQMTLGATRSPQAIYEMGRQIGRECKAMGIHINFAPVADINNNPKNPVINSRSFGENKEDVALLSAMYAKGLQDEGIIACGKHFPGHGNTDVDSHLALPIINSSAHSLDSIELYPFRNVIKEGIASMMVAHISIPSIIKSEGTPASLSGEVIDSLLIENLGFKGLIFTDALNMKAVTSMYPPGTIEIKAIEAGNDVLLFSENIKLAIDSIRQAVVEGRLDTSRINRSVRKILVAKHYTIDRNGTFSDGSAVKNGKLFNDGNHTSAKLFNHSITLLHNKNKTIPVKNFSNKRIASLVVNDTTGNPFQLMLNNYARVDMYRVDKEPTKGAVDTLLASLVDYDYVIFSIHNTSTKATSNYGISDPIDQFIIDLSKDVKLITVLFGNSYGLSRIPGSQDADALIISYEDTNWPQHFTAQAIFGASDLTGRLPVTATSDHSYNSGTDLQAVKGVIEYQLPEHLGIDTKDFEGVDSIVNMALDAHAMPGCRILMAHKGSVIFNRSYGYHTYDSLLAVKEPDVYDIASVTKITATALAVMKLVESNQLDVNKKLFKYLPETKRTNKKNLIISDILTHNAGLRAWLPLYKNLLAEGLPDTTLLKDFPTDGYSTSITNCLYLKDDYNEELWGAIISSDVSKNGTYVYSDLGMIIMQKVVEKITGMGLFEYVDKHFYKPMGLHRIVRSPVTDIQLNEVIPTEYDSVLRCELIHGFVHDPVASMMGGMGGHAGLFSDANSLAVIMQMLINGGDYAGVRYLSTPVVRKFTQKYHEGSFNRRGLVFDKPQLIRTPDGPTAVSASPEAFGHSGFTGTCVWADPENEIVYIFLSNRVYPTAKNKKLGKMNIRTDIMEQFYQVIENNSQN